MLEEILDNFLPILINILEIMGIIVILIGSIKAFYHYILGTFERSKYPIKYKFANTLATGLEFKLAGEILKTVLVKSLDEIAIIAAVSILRGFMSLIIYFEMKNEAKEEK